jgi:hypothetical protein
LDPRSTRSRGSVADLGDREVEVVLGHLCVSLFGVLIRLGVYTHEPCTLVNSKAIQKTVRCFFEECFRAPYSQLFGHSRVALQHGAMTQSKKERPHVANGGLCCDAGNHHRCGGFRTS